MVTFYSTGCPRCKTLKMKLEQKKVDFVECTDEEEMTKLGLTSAPALGVDGKIYNFSEAIKYLGTLK